MLQKSRLNKQRISFARTKWRDTMAIFTGALLDAGPVDSTTATELRDGRAFGVRVPGANWLKQNAPPAPGSRIRSLGVETNGNSVEEMLEIGLMVMMRLDGDVSSHMEPMEPMETL